MDWQNSAKRIEVEGSRLSDEEGKIAQLNKETLQVVVIEDQIRVVKK